MSHFSPSLEPLFFSFSFLEPFFFILFHISQRCGSAEKSDKVRMKSHFFPSFILYLVLHFSEVRKCRINWQSQANETNKQKNRVTPARDSVFTVTVKHIVAHGAVSARWYPGKYGLWQFYFLNCSKKQPTTIFCKISVRSSKYCLETKFPDNCSIHVKIFVNSLQFSEV